MRFARLNRISYNHSNKPVCRPWCPLDNDALFMSDFFRWLPLKTAQPLELYLGIAVLLLAGAMMLSVIVLSAQQQKSGIDESEC